MEISVLQTFHLVLFLVLHEEVLAETCLVISSALIPSLLLSHMLEELILSDYVADKGIPRTTVTAHIGFT